MNDEADFISVRTHRPGSFEARASADPHVRYLAEDADDVLAATLTPNDPKLDSQWGFGPAPGVDAFDAWDTTTGSTDVRVAVIDSGVDADHEDLANLVDGYDFYNGDGVPEDNCGHGTHVAGTVGAVTDNGRGVAGTAQVSILPLKALEDHDGSCYGSFSAVANAITYAADHGADVVTMSLGCEGCHSQSVEDAMAYANDRDVLVTAAAGNGYGGPVNYPGSSSRAVAVSAVDRDGDSPSFVSTGPEVELAAPGVSILSTTPGDGYRYKSGTSMATPHVAGVAALVRSAHSISHAELRETLTATASDLGLSAERQGAGAVNADAALASLADANRAPTASLASSCSELSCSFDGTGSSDPDGDALTYSWSFGDGIGGSGETVTHTYDQAGDYTVTLTVTDPDGAQDTAAQTVSVEEANGAPSASFASDCTDLSCSFDASNSSDPDGDQLTYEWSLGDGTSATGQTVNHTYDAAGSYTVQLTVTDPDGASDSTSRTVSVDEPNGAPTAAFVDDCTDLSCAFDASNSSDPDGDQLAYAWSFGDGIGGSGTTVTHTYDQAGDYTVQLTVTDPDGAEDTASRTVTATEPNAAPNAAFTSSCSEVSCSFDASDSSDPDGDQLAYEWSLGDGTSATGQTVDHTYDAGGDYTVTLTVTDPDGASDETTSTVTATEPNRAPTAGFTSDCSDLSCAFDASGSSDPDGDSLTYSWSFGDGIGGSGETVTHTYDQAGQYTVTLTVTDPEGASDSAGRIVSVEEANGAPSASFASDCADLSCSFDASGSSDPDGDALSYAWTFGDGVGGSGATISHAYDAAGDYTVTLTVTDPDGASDRATRTVSVSEPSGPSEPAMHVKTIYQYLSGDSPFVIAWVYDSEGNPVEDAAIRVPVCKADGDCRTFTGYTSARGALSFSWPGQGGGEYRSCVTSVEKDGWTWDKSANSAPDVMGQCRISEI